MGGDACGGTSTDHKQYGDTLMKRQRGRGRKPGGGHHGGNQFQPNRTMESNGPDIKVRGPAAHIYERYLQLARDATSSGDRVLGENYLQHADHYFRLVRAMQPAMPPPSDRADEQEGEGEDEGASEAVNGAEAAGDEQPDVDFPEGQQPQRSDRGEGDFRRRRGRRGRYRPEGEGAEAREGGERREPANEERTRRPRDEEQQGPEGFSNGPKPAFLRD